MRVLVVEEVVEAEGGEDGQAQARDLAGEVARASAVQPPPPTSATGRFARSSSVWSSAMAAGSGAGMGDAGAAHRRRGRRGSVSMSSGRATTTGPGRPERAVVHARATISGIRSALSISTAHLATGPKKAA
jgi:hypothetical protein